MSRDSLAALPISRSFDAFSLEAQAAPEGL
jgi:hypothetical protein